MTLGPLQPKRCDHWPPTQRYVALAAIFALIAGCTDPPPKLGRGAPRLVADIGPYFDGQVKSRFPVGSDEAGLRAELHREGFSIREADPSAQYRFAATYEERQFVCKAWWTLSWNTDGGAIAGTKGDYRQLCL